MAEVDIVDNGDDIDQMTCECCT